jgi:hypothetical protein
MLANQAENIELEYSKHKSLIVGVDEMSDGDIISGVKHVNGKLILFDMQSNIKFQDAKFSA